MQLKEYKTRFQVCSVGTHTGISFSYDDSSGTFSATVGAEFIQDTVGAMFSSNTETNITVGYEDGDGTIDLAVEQQYCKQSHIIIQLQSQLVVVSLLLMELHNK